MVMKKSVIFIIALLVLIVAGVFYKNFNLFSDKQEEIYCTMDAMVCPDGTSVGRIAPNCEFAECRLNTQGITIIYPQANEPVTSPLIITGRAIGQWFFEAQFNAELYDSDGVMLGTSILTAEGEWMTEDFVPFQGTMEFANPKSATGTLRFLSANPSGLPEHQKTYDVLVSFSGAETRSVLLFYYNPEIDKDEKGNIMCSENGLVAIRRAIVESEFPIKDTLELLLEGSENLSDFDKQKGITTEFPLEGLTLTDANLNQNGNLDLKFADPNNKTSGGSCRVNILRLQIEETAKQFSNVKSVEILPEELFQP
jgi:hypothetical protein